MTTQYVYTLTFADPNKNTVIVVPGTSTGPGKNDYDTSLDLVGPGYVGYGQSIAQNFVKVLENFAGPNPPQHAIEGQLWYDTSNSNRKVLRVNNGELSSARWPSATGIYQQSNDPATQYLQNVKDGDIWVDIGNNQLKIRYSEEWTTVGPSTSATENKNGLEVVTVEATTGDDYPLILNWVDGNVVSITSYFEFTPRIVIDGFSLLKPGINLTNKVVAKFNGLADRANALEVSRGVLVRANEVMKNKIPPSSKQVHTGTLVVESIGGLIVRRNSITPEIKIYSDQTNAYVSFTGTNAFMRVGLENKSYISFNTNGKIGFNTTASLLTATNATLTVNGGATFSDRVTISTATSSTTVLSVGGSTTISGNATISGNVRIAGRTTVTNTLTVINLLASTSTAVIGSTSTPFDYIYVKNIGTIGTGTGYINGLVEKAVKLETFRTFRIEGIITSTNVTFNGTGNVILTATTNASLITGTSVTTSTTATQTLLVVNTATGAGQLNQISKADFLADVYSSLFVTGMVLPYGGIKSNALPNRGAPTGWKWCDGETTSTAAENALYAVIGNRYSSSTTVVGSFQVPNTSTFITTGTGTGTNLEYIIKT